MTLGRWYWRKQRQQIWATLSRSLVSRGKRNGAVARWGSGVTRVLFFFFLSRKNKSISQKDEANG